MKLVPLNQLFDINYGNKLDLNKMKVTQSGGVAFVNRTGFNNGVVAMVDPVAGVDPYPPGLLTVALGGSVLSTFLQIKPFYTGQNVAVAMPKESLTEHQLLYYAVAIRSNRFRYSTCGREANRTFRTLLVPDISEVPEWVSEFDLDVFAGADRPAGSAGADPFSSEWRLFRLSDLFELKKGKRLTKAEMRKRPGPIPFIGAIDSNNGLAGSVDAAIHEAGTLTVNYNGAGVAEAFYQPVPFWASDDVNVLYPRFPLTPEVALFIATVIRKEKYRFSYGRKWHLERMTESEIHLPADKHGEPDWWMMGTFIKSLPFSYTAFGAD